MLIVKLKKILIDNWAIVLGLTATIFIIKNCGPC
jgi:hypothetical protein